MLYYVISLYSVFFILSKYEKVSGLKVFFNQYHSFTLFFEVEYFKLRVSPVQRGQRAQFSKPNVIMSWTRGSMPRTSCLSFE